MGLRFRRLRAWVGPPKLGDQSLGPGDGLPGGLLQIGGGLVIDAYRLG